ncbi:carboxypeptidase regulatory-like domain-containing protein, partial [bacterium]|nr:carboxypeptidase regulatory-like domain-containing protein [bacterium]
GLAEPVGGDISGTITLDGGTGNVENVVVRADGLGAPVANPAANGSYLLEDVLVGERYVWATLANYQTTGTTVTLSEAGLTNINITLIRNLPPAPTGFTASVNAETGLITASWNASTDPMVDQYYLLKRYEGDTEWITAETTTATNVTHQLTSPGVYQVAVAAVDVDASSPVVSEPSEFVRLLYGELPPVGLVYSGDHDNTISLYWFEPGTEPAVELSYDNGINSMWDAIGWSWLEEPPPFGWIVSKFEANGLAAVTQVRVYFNNYDATIIGDPFQIGIFPDDGFRMPTFEPLAVIDAVHEAPLNRWRDFEFIPPIVIPDGIFYIGTRQMSIRTVGLGGDIQTPFVTETFYWSFDGSQWDPYEPWELTIPMQRCVAYGDFGQEIVLTPAPIDIPLDRLTTAWELVDAYSRQSGAVPPNLFTLGGQQILGNRMIPIGMPASLLLERAQNAVAPHPPTITIARSDSRRPSNTLDDVDYFIVYRDGLDISHPLELNYDDAGLMEGTDYHYYVTAHYDNGNESGPSPAVDAQCNMEPMPPTNLNGANEGDTSMRLTWTDPTLNRDGSPCVDLTSVQVFRDGTLAGSVAAGIQEYLDTPPDGAGTYSWTVKAADEVPNISAESVSFFGAVGNPSYSNGFEFDDGLWTTDEGWERGVPTSGPFAAHGGENCWATILAGDYPGNACYLMTLDIQLAVASASATLEFWAWWDIEGGWDGCNFKASVDGGQTWDIVEPQGGYPTVTNNVNTCNPNEPVWSNHPGLWQYIVIPIGQYIGQVPIFQFVFGSDPIVNYSGYYLDDMTIWGLQEPVTASVTGQVTLDGGAGDVEEVIVRADGLGVPQTNPAANGSYTLENVLVGNRTIRGFLDGYNVASTPVFVTEVGPNVANLTLIRSNPPIVTGLTGSVDNATGEVTLNWDDSPDALVDFYYIYTRVHNTAPWTNVATAPLSQTVYTLPADGIWDITVTAVDEDVSTPVESAQAPYITVLYGALPPNNLTAIGNFDDRIRLNWFEPGNDFGQELAYDDGTAEAFVTVTTVNGDEDRLAVMFSPPPANEILYPLEITACAVFLENESSIASLSICPTQEWDNMPDIWVPYITWNDVAADAAPGWLTVETGGTVTLNEPTDFWLVVQLTPGQHGPGVGGDNTAANNRSFYGQWSWEWTQDSNFDYMMRIWIRGGGGLRSGGSDEYLLSVGETEGCRIESIPRTSAVLSEKSDHKNAKQMKSAVRTLDEPEMIADKASTAGKAGKTTVSEKSQAAVSKYNLKNSGERSPFVKAPELRLQSREPRDGTLDDIDYYIVYRDGADVGHPTGTTYDDIGLAENVFHTYQVTSHYDDGDESAPSNTASAACNMAPAPPIGLTGTPIGSTQMRLDWANPTTNQDGTPLTDLASIRIYRDGSQIGSVAAGTATFTDTPPENDQPYTWTVRALDEVPNVSLDSEPFVGYVVSPWEEVDYEWIDISTSGINTGITGDDAVGGPFDLGFSIEYFGQTYSSIYACTNGWASFAFQDWGEYLNTALPNPAVPNTALYPFWDDLWVSGTASIKYFADTQNGRFILTWDQVPHLSSSSPNTFQIVISENGGIQFNYQTLTVAESPDHTVGVENADGTSAIQLCYNANGPWCAEENSSIAFWGRPQGEIRGQVRVFGSNQPIQNASIWSVGFVDTAYTDATGFYSLPVDTGSHNLMIHKQGYCDQLFPDIHIADDQSYVQNASMLWPNAQFSVTSINLLTRPGHNVSGTFEISNPNAGCQLEYSITTTQTWLSVSIEEGNVPVNETQLITVTANVAGISDGEYSADLVITHNDEDSPHTIPVNLVVGIDERAAPLPTEFAFHQNYPNPFNAVTSFGIDLPAEARVEIVIFNVMGQEVARPVRADYPAGRHSILFNAEALPSGMYLARMTAGEFSGLQKIVLLK